MGIVESAAPLLIVMERDKHVRLLLEDFLTRAGCTLLFCDDGTSALALIRERRPSLVITEALVPGLDGFTLCRAVKFTPGTSDIPVIILSVVGSPQRAVLAGADGFLLKPVEERKLLDSVGLFLPHLRSPPPGAPMELH